MLAVAHLMIVARSFGVDSYPMEGFSTAQLKEAFNILAEVDVCCLLALVVLLNPLNSTPDALALDSIYFGESYGEPFKL